MSEQQRRILLVEDSHTQAERFRALFHDEGWDVACVSSAEEALERLSGLSPDLVVLDFHLPGMEGDAFCREIRMNVNTRGIPVLMLTAEDATDIETRGLESGADDYLSKAADTDVLLLRVRALLRKSPGREPVLAAAEDSFRRPRVLAIDGSPTYLEFIARELGAENWVVAKSPSGRDALERLRRESFDCVLIDLVMLEMDGAEVGRRVAELRGGMERPFAVVILTAHDGKESLVRALESGADDFISKSSEPSVLKARIRALLRQRAMADQNRRILEEFKNKELEAMRARAEKETAEMRAMLAEKLAAANRDLEIANRKLTDALEVTRAITDHAAEALFLTNAQGRATFVNPAAERLFGFGREELLGEVVHEKLCCTRTDGNPSGDCPLSDALRTGRRFTAHDGVFRRKDGSSMDVACSCAPVISDGAVTAAVLVVSDISERKRSEERLRRTQKLESIGVLAGGIAHDFNNILVGVLGTASLLETEVPPNALEGIRSIMDSAQRAAGLTRQLLAYAGKGQFVIRDLDLSAVVRDMTGLLRLSVPKSIEVRFDLARRLPPAPADPTQFQQIVMNLVINGGEAIGAEKSGTVLVCTRAVQIAEPFVDATGADIPPGDYVSLEVQDTGCGMERETQARIFEPFFTTKFIGRGLGLAAVSGIVRSHKGAIVIDSAPGAGSTFRVLFPAVKSAEAKPPGGPTVLVVDDEEGVRDFLVRALHKYGYEVVVASEGKEALALWESRPGGIDLVLLDLIMPVMGGHEFVAEIKRREPAVKLLLTSGYEETEVRRLCAAYGDLLFIQKPYSAQELADKVKAALEQG
ncbi:MAG: response regulator [Acidobacteriia bacterium]|nr:response regulator [Terriglobia bacterium]